MKYVVDLDGLKDCLSFIHSIKVNGEPMVYLSDVKNFIDMFPKDKVEDGNPDPGDKKD